MNAASAEWVCEALEPLGAVRPRAMFGGIGFSLDGLTFAIAAFGELHIKADAESAATFEVRGLNRFTFEMNGKIASTGYYCPPEECLDDADALQEWAVLGPAAARRAAAARSVRRRKGAA